MFQVKFTKENGGYIKTLDTLAEVNFCLHLKLIEQDSVKLLLG